MTASFLKKCFLLCFLLILGYNKSEAQIKSAEIGINGLTCSQCCRSVEMEIRKLDFVEDIEVNLEHTEGKIKFKSGSKIAIERIAKAITNAGFSTRYLKVTYDFLNFEGKNGACFTEGENHFQFVKISDRILNGEFTLILVGKSFLPPKEYKTWKNELNPTCFDKKHKTLFVTL